ncbi:branched-chain amino acid ABC transporter permease [Blastococcus sp. Marseille-P5729]|uniref:branched-chain amino acid ABC transporter permease n=1 Tax=Blastococcus sp. Marseille-P5729 TaxID=2086582 RepID=UPI000D10D492|nr:branched-chain amino acid ABC transporter permease [Blastococcus sp. Marseille-P5729]
MSATNAAPVRSTHPNPVVRWWDDLGKGPKIALTLAGVAFLVVLPILRPPGLSGGPNDFALVMAECARMALIALGLNIVVGLAGLLDLGYIGFYAIAAYVVALLTSSGSDWADTISINWFAAVPIAVVITAISGLFLGIPTLRVRGDYLAIVTLGFGELVRLAADNIPWLKGNGGFKQIDYPRVLTSDELPNGVFSTGNVNKGAFNYGVWWYWALLLMIALVIWATNNLEKSRVGRAWISLREDEDAAEIMGVQTFKYKVWAFAIGAGVGGLSGAFMAGQVQFVNNQKFDVVSSIFFVVAVVLGGQGNKFGVIIGAFLVAYIPARFAEIAEYKYLIFGVVLIIIMLFRPQGLLPARHRLMGAGPDIPPVTDPVITGHTEPDTDVEGQSAHVVPGTSPMHKYESGPPFDDGPGDLDGIAGDDRPGLPKGGDR